MTSRQVTLDQWGYEFSRKPYKIHGPGEPDRLTLSGWKIDWATAKRINETAIDQLAQDAGVRLLEATRNDILIALKRDKETLEVALRRLAKAKELSKNIGEIKESEKLRKMIAIYTASRDRMVIVLSPLAA